jgi:DNA topoisomerase-1
LLAARGTLGAMQSFEAAREAGLRYVDDRQPGIGRRRRGRHFSYVYSDGSQVRDPHEIERIKALAIPPAYTHVWIAPIANGHIQATGRDARGRKQYRYHKRWREVRDEAKYQRLVAFGRALPAIRAAVAKDLGGEGLSRRKVLGAIVAIMDSTGIRVGNEEYVKANGSFGLTTLRNRHARVDGSTVRLRFRGKTGRESSIALDDRRLAKIVKRCRDLPGEELFSYVDESGSASALTSDDVNAYIREVAGEEFSAKDFRTWIGTVQCIAALSEPAANHTEAKHKITEALACVAARLGNTPAVCRKAYVHPAVIETYERKFCLPPQTGRAAARQRRAKLSQAERFALHFVRRWERREPLEKTLERSVRKARH